MTGKPDAEEEVVVDEKAEIGSESESEDSE